MRILWQDADSENRKQFDSRRKPCEKGILPRLSSQNPCALIACTVCAFVPPASCKKPAIVEFHTLVHIP